MPSGDKWKSTFSRSPFLREKATYFFKRKTGLNRVQNPVTLILPLWNIEK